MNKSSIAVFALSTMLAACSASEDPSNAGAATGQPAGAVASDLSGEYLAGKWCYTGYTAGGETSIENINYVFDADGTLKYQTNSSTPVTQDGSWDVSSGALIVKPALAMFKQEPAKINPDGFETNAMGATMTWVRGECTPQ